MVQECREAALVYSKCAEPTLSCTGPHGGFGTVVCSFTDNPSLPLTGKSSQTTSKRSGLTLLLKNIICSFEVTETSWNVMRKLCIPPCPSCSLPRTNRDPMDAIPRGERSAASLPLHATILIPRRQGYGTRQSPLDIH